MSRYQVPTEYIVTADVLHQIQLPSVVFVLIVTKYQFTVLKTSKRTQNLKQFTCSAADRNVGKIAARRLRKLFEKSQSYRTEKANTNYT